MHGIQPQAGDPGQTLRLNPAAQDVPTSRLNGPIVPEPEPGSESNPPDALFPAAGERFLHFDLVEQIGRGAFARVFLAKQESLANRLVVLKVTAVPTDEPQKLARLRHTNVVPVYSVHQAGPVQAVCMPYLGRTTLAHVVARLVARSPRPDSGRDLLGTLFADRPAAAPGPPVRIGPADAPDRPAPANTDALDAAARMSFVEACLWVVAQLAAGLAHAHARGILHRDLKPGNVLITDDGVPMLLDFNVSSDSALRGSDGRVGGTLPYMAPEHVRAFLGAAEPVGERSDLYSLGVILHELLTGTVLFPQPSTPRTAEEVAGVLASRKALPPPPSAANPAVTPAVDAITLKLLDPIPALRYASAEDLREDLLRQLAHRPLAFAADTSVRERVRKWRRRNPRLATGLVVAALAGVFLVLPAGIAVAYAHESRRQVEEENARLAARDHEARRVEAAAGFRAATDELRNAAAMLGSRTDPAFRDQGLALARGVLARYGADDDPGWEDRPGCALLEPGQRAALRNEFAEVLVLMTRAEARKGDSPESVAAALRWNELAAGLFPEAGRPAVVARQREELESRRAGRPVPALAAPGADSPRDADLYFDGLDLAAADRFREAAPLLARYCDRHPDRFLAWFARGVCHDGLGQPADAAAAFAVCVALRPDFAHAHLDRGLARLKQQRYAEADADFTRALQLKRDWPPALVNRGLAREGLRRFRDAEADFTAALADPAARTRVFFLRSRVRAKAGDKPGADADRAEGMRREPADALSWATRGTWRMAKEPDKALADFDAALALSPSHHDALVNKAVVLAEHLNRQADAVPVFDRLLELYPDDVNGRGGRAMCLARLGRADEARRDAETCLKADASAFRLYQMAGLHAQLSKSDASGKSKAEALRLLARAFQTGFNDWKMLKTDADLDPVRGDSEFAKLVSAATALDRAGR